MGLDDSQILTCDRQWSIRRAVSPAFCLCPGTVAAREGICHKSCTNCRFEDLLYASEGIGMYNLFQTYLMQMAMLSREKYHELL